MQLECRQILDAGQSAYQAAMQIYFDSFPPNERQPLSKIAERVAAGKSLLFVGTLNNEVVSMALLWDFEHSDFTLLDYMAVAEKYRGLQYGSILFNFLSDEIKSKGKYLLIEVEHHLFGQNQLQRQKRILFYLKNGACLLANVPYLLPALDGTDPTIMRLMIAPCLETDKITPAVIGNLIIRLYTEVYEKTAENEELITLLKQLPSKIYLTNTLS